MSRQYLQEKEFNSADRALDQAADEYISIFQAGAKPGGPDYVVPRVVAGLLRCGRSTEALRIVSQLPEDDEDRAYLSAESYFSLGDRQSAALMYERWIALGCGSRLVMILDGVYGGSWTTVLEIRPAGQTRCEQIPIELRTRLETLKRMYFHPKNLPERSYPGVIVPIPGD